jgi:hypothetical protein
MIKSNSPVPACRHKDHICQKADRKVRREFIYRVFTLRALRFWPQALKQVDFWFSAVEMIFQTENIYYELLKVASHSLEKAPVIFIRFWNKCFGVFHLFNSSQIFPAQALWDPDIDIYQEVSFSISVNLR